MPDGGEYRVGKRVKNERKNERKKKRKKEKRLEEEKKNNEEKERKSERVVVVLVVVLVESERWSTLKGGNKTGGGMTVSVLHMPLQVGTQ